MYLLHTIITSASEMNSATPNQVAHLLSMSEHFGLNILNTPYFKCIIIFL